MSSKHCPSTEPSEAFRLINLCIPVNMSEIIFAASCCSAVFSAKGNIQFNNYLIIIT